MTKVNINDDDSQVHPRITSMLIIRVPVLRIYCRMEVRIPSTPYLLRYSVRSTIACRTLGSARTKQPDWKS